LATGFERRWSPKVPLTTSLDHILGVDIGGTFTDVLLRCPGGSLFQKKIPTSVPDFGKAVLEGLEAIIDDSGIGPDALGSIIHGTTVATNAILESRGARTALVTTRGFRDVLEIGRLRHPSLYNYFWEKPKPLAPRDLRFELSERTGPQGEIQETPSDEEIEAFASKIEGLGLQSVAICFINSYANPANERSVADALRRRFPDLYVSVSCEILPEIKEYERTSTTVVNAYIQPTVDRYLADLANGFATRGAKCPVLIMQSSGGLMTVDVARAKPVQLVESGPAAGVIATRVLARALGLPHVIALDVGGTTAKASLIENGEPFEASEYEVGGGMNRNRNLMSGGGYPLRMPSLDIAEVGAGGGSIAWIDAGGAPRVGPQSAGAHPGPACYGGGGLQPTVTDACVVLGYINPTEIAGGAQKIDQGAAVASIERIATPLALGVDEAAYGVYEIAVANMSKAIRAVTSERGRDPRDFVLIAFGGAGPALAVAMARDFGIDKVIVPVGPGLFSTLGLLVADIEEQDVVSHRNRLAIDADEINHAFGAMEARLLAQMAGHGFAPGDLELSRFADVRYAGQSFELRIPLPAGRYAEAQVAEIRERFEAEHEKTYGHRGVAGQDVEIINLRLKAVHRRKSWNPSEVMIAAHGSLEAAREAYFGKGFGWMRTPVLARSDLSLNQTTGPLIVEDMDATTVVPPGSRAHRDSWGNILIEVGR
jgi:N-methylhydantoinase A